MTASTVKFEAQFATVYPPRRAIGELIVRLLHLVSRFLVVFFAVPLFLPSLTFAKRAAPPEVKPVVYQGVRYIAPNDNGRRAYIEAWDVRTNKKLWDVTVFTNRIDPKLEGDVQHVFIKALSIRDETLIVTSERGETYRVDLKTKGVTQSEQPNTALEPAVRAEILALENQWATAIVTNAYLTPHVQTSKAASPQCGSIYKTGNSPFHPRASCPRRRLGNRSIRVSLSRRAELD